jgi:hypothetical protein
MGGMVCFWKGEYVRCTLEPLSALEDRLSSWMRRALETGFNNAMARTFQEGILPNAQNRNNRPAGLHGIKYPSMFYIPIHLWVSPILHGEVGLVNDWLMHVGIFCDIPILETLPEDKVNFCEHLVILGDMMENL